MVSTMSSSYTSKVKSSSGVLITKGNHDSDTDSNSSKSMKSKDEDKTYLTKILNHMNDLLKCEELRYERRASALALRPIESTLITTYQRQCIFEHS